MGLGAAISTPLTAPPCSGPLPAACAHSLIPCSYLFHLTRFCSHHWSLLSFSISNLNLFFVWFIISCWDMVLHGSFHRLAPALFFSDSEYQGFLQAGKKLLYDRLMDGPNCV